MAAAIVGDADREVSGGLIAAAMDGKTLGNTGAPGTEGSEITLFSALPHADAIVIAQVRVPEDTNEITQVAALLDGVDLTGVVVTGDAAHAQHATAAYLAGEQAAPKDLARLIREHWTVENKSRWVRDVVYREDHQHAYAGTGSSPSSRSPPAQTDFEIPPGGNWTHAFRLATANCAHEILTIVPATRLDESVESVLLPGAEVLESGGSMRVAKEIAESGMEVRNMAEFPTWLTIIGREIVLAPRDPTEPRVGTLVIRASGYVAMALWLFERLWSSARPLSEQYDSRPRLSELERQLLPHLTSGAKDETAARELGVSVRTYRRHVTRLCDVLGASSRFEAGVLAAQVGLV